MTRKPADISEVIPFSDKVDQTRVPPRAKGFMIERHVPTLFDTPYHHHTSVELNFLRDCDMIYSFSGAEAHLNRNRVSVFWGAAPHRVIDVTGKGLTTNIYVSLGQFMRWGLPVELVETILSGAVICSSGDDPMDRALFDRLYSERDRQAPPWHRMHLGEIETRLRRIALEGWTTLLASRSKPAEMETTAQAMLHVEAMLRFIADNFTIPVTVADIAMAANLSTSRAAELFRQVMGVTLKQQLLRARLSHARMLLTETDTKVSSVALDSGFASLSSFYEAFTKANNISPAKYRSNARRSNPFIARHSKI